MFRCEMVANVNIWFSAFCFEIRQCNSDINTNKNNSVSAPSTDKVLSNIRSKMFQIHLLKNVP